MHSTLAQFFAALAVMLGVFTLGALVEKFLQRTRDNEPVPVSDETRDHYYNEAP